MDAEETGPTLRRLAKVVIEGGDVAGMGRKVTVDGVRIPRVRAVSVQHEVNNIARVTVTFLTSDVTWLPPERPTASAAEDVASQVQQADFLHG